MSHVIKLWFGIVCYQLSLKVYFNHLKANIAVPFASEGQDHYGVWLKAVDSR